MKLFAFVRDVAEAGAKQMLWVVIRWEVVLGSPGVLRVRVCADVAGAGAKWLLWAVIKWEGGFWGGGLTWGHSRFRQYRGTGSRSSSSLSLWVSNLPGLARMEQSRGKGAGKGAEDSPWLL